MWTLRARGSLLGLGLLTLLFTACGGMQPLGDLLRPQTPWESYRDSLRAAQLETTVAGRAWMAASERAIEQAPTIGLPHREVVHFDPLRPTAGAWKLTLSRGQELRVAVSGPSHQEQRLFVDLMRHDGTEWESVVALAEEGELRRRIEVDGNHALRVQPELLAGGRWTITVETGASLAFPVAGRSSRAIGGRFGDPRDGGRRRHQGVDIFAEHGASAIASADGVASRVGDNRLGGKVVWLRTDDGLGLYYAHLDEQLVGRGARVAAGDVIGRVGNTGNAAGTPPHLHFGIYDGGPVDPFPFVHEPRIRPAEVAAELSRLGRWTRVARSRVHLRGAPDRAAEIHGGATRNEALKVEGASSDWYRVSSRAGVAYVHSGLVEPIETPVRRLRVEETTHLLHEPVPSSLVVGEVAAGTDLDLLAEWQGYWLVRPDPDSRPSWMPRTAA